jgi:hypothetical protein
MNLFSGMFMSSSMTALTQYGLQMIVQEALRLSVLPSNAMLQRYMIQGNLVACSSSVDHNH